MWCFVEGRRQRLKVHLDDIPRSTEIVVSVIAASDIFRYDELTLLFSLLMEVPAMFLDDSIVNEIIYNNNLFRVQIPGNMFPKGSCINTNKVNISTD